MYRVILAMSESKRTIQSELKSHCKEMYVHIAKLVMYPNNSARNDWIKQIYSFIHATDKWSNKKKWPPYDFIMKSTWEAKNDLVENFMILADDEVDQFEYEEWDYNHVYSVMGEYSRWLALQLSQRGAVTHTQVRNKLDELVPRTK